MPKLSKRLLPGRMVRFTRDISKNSCLHTYFARKENLGEIVEDTGSPEILAYLVANYDTGESFYCHAREVEKI